MKRIVALLMTCLLFLTTTPLGAMAEDPLLELIANARDWAGTETEWVILSPQTPQRMYKLTVAADGYYNLYVESEYDVGVGMLQEKSVTSWETMPDLNRAEQTDAHLTQYLQTDVTYYLSVYLEEETAGPVAVPVTFIAGEEPPEVPEYGVGFYEETMTVSVGDAFLPAYWIGFRDIRGTITSADESIIVAEQAGWRYIAKAPGETTVTMTSDSGGTATITVRVTEPPAWELDQRITVKSTLYNNGQTTYTFTPEADGVYVFRSFGDYNTSIKIYDPEGNLVSNSSGGLNDLNFHTAATLTGSETYQIHLDCNAPGTFEAVVHVAVNGDITMELAPHDYLYREGDTYYVYTGTTARDYVIFGGEASVIRNFDAEVANPHVATYDAGDRTFHFLAPGKTEVTAWAEGSTDTFTIVVVNFVPGDITLDGRVTEADTELLTAYLAGEEVGARWFLLDYNDDGTVDALDVAAMEEAMAALPGDVDGDGTITSTDARLVLQYYAGKVNETALNIAVADVDSDGAITSTDARLILQMYAGKINSFPAG